MTASASVLIRARNEAEHIGATLEAVFAQHVAPLEVIVVDGGSTDGTLDVARRHPVRILEVDAKGWTYGRALNVAARAASGDVLVALSAHCRPAGADWLGALLRHFDDPAVAGAWGAELAPGGSSDVPGDIQRQRPGSYVAETRRFGLSNANAALRRSLWSELPFDERIPAAEDKEWARRAMALGYDIVYDPSAAVIHPRHPLRHAFRRTRAIEAGLALMFPDGGSRRGRQVRGARGRDPTGGGGVGRVVRDGPRRLVLRVARAAGHRRTGEPPGGPSAPTPR